MSMKEILETSIKNAGLSEAEVAEWVTDLKRYHDEETKRQGKRLEQLKVLEESHNLAVENFNIAQKQLEREHQLLSRERELFTQEREAFARERQAFTREREMLEGTRKNQEPDIWDRLLFAFLGGMAALLVFQLIWWLGNRLPGIVAWVRGLF